MCRDEKDVVILRTAHGVCLLLCRTQYKHEAPASGSRLLPSRCRRFEAVIFSGGTGSASVFGIKYSTQALAEPAEPVAPLISRNCANCFL